MCLDLAGLLLGNRADSEKDGPRCDVLLLLVEPGGVL